MDEVKELVEKYKGCFHLIPKEETESLEDNKKSSKKRTNIKKSKKKSRRR